MEDKKYSVDDILNEYSGSSDKKSSDTNGLNVDDILGSYGEPEKKSKPKISLHNTDLFSKLGKKADAEPDEFARKYDKLSEAVNSIKERSPKEPYVPEPKPDRSFSEKFEQEDIYGDKPEPEEKPKIKFPKPEKKPPVQEAPHKPEAPIQSAAADTPKIINDPFEKYSSMEEQDNEDIPEQAPAVTEIFPRSSTDLDDILNEYSEKKKKTVRSENTFHKGITDFFTKLVPKQGSEEISGNTELLDGMMKAKRERISRTQHVAPIERKSINDINLNLDDKILPDTSQLNIDNEQRELDKISALKERRSKKIKDFVLVGEEEDVSDEETAEDESSKVIDDFEDIADAPSIAHDIAQLKGSLILRLVVLIICFAASAYIAIANDIGNVMDLLDKRTQVSTFLFVNAILGLFAGFSSYTVISCGLSKIFSLKADCDSLCAVSVVSSIASAMIMFANENLIRGRFVHIYISVAIASLLFNTLGKLFIVTRTQKSFRFVSGSSEKYAVFPITDEETAQNFTRGALSDFPNLAAMRKTEFISDFLKTTYSSDSTDRFCRIATPVVLASAIVIGVIAGLLSREEHSSSAVYIGISVFVAVVSICTGFSTMLIVNLPMLRAAKKNAENQGVILGYDCIEEFSEINSVLIDADQLFPQGSVKLAAIKVFSDTRIDEAIVEAASLTTHAGSILKNMFYDIIAGKTELLNPVESYIFEDSMGLCGWINNKRVLLGNRDLMVNHSIEGMPPVAKEKEYTENGRHAVYLSISGELSAMFLVEITPTMEISHALRDLQKNDIYIMVRSVDSLVSINRLSELFDISPEYLKLVPFRIHEQFSEVTAYQMKQRATLACSGKFSALSSLILSCKRMKTTIGFGIGIQAVSIILGILICLAMVVLNGFQELSVSMELTFCFAFTAVLVVFQLLRKN
ncbi:MAG: cation-translocating P-type ATPase [Oscillospiraceae bacterium]|nr:cation-translocating P-type ATPase [Oscillospiraceae bacterium]